ncbi:pilus assembly protein [Sphingomonas daechungensis]|uniref:Pilus assembly protein n=1 Tax=Sphingomonas daechungensis TaxID=1176646 RepID=A0ABX6T620_9SPHN|nr:TadE/TadG family type IV pilus assembly protein [Sphingomonas daechungensis]QNP43068.1 pilus assembly protein [Sphingomonas daechungensis]
MLSRLLRQQSGAAAAEMALVAPLLIALMFGSMELGHYFYSEHVVVKAVRDGARFAARQSFADFTCPAGTIGGTVVADTQNVTRTNQLAAGGTPRLAGWTNAASVSVTATCVSNSSGTYVTAYGSGTEIPIVVVQASVPYTSLFSVIGFNSAGLQLRATERAVVMGI